MWRFTDLAGDLFELVFDSFPSSMILPSSSEEVIELFSNGDRMTINIPERAMSFDGVNPTSIGSSRLNMKRHIWLSKGYIRPVSEA